MGLLLLLIRLGPGVDLRELDAEAGATEPEGLEAREAGVQSVVKLRISKFGVWVEGILT